MTWEFRLARKVVNYNHPLKGDISTTLYGLVEVYYDSEGKVKGWTDFIDPNGWDNVEDLRVTLEKMLKALDKPLFEEQVEDSDFDKL
jgi:hypothetical protein